MRFHQACNLISMYQHVTGTIYLDMQLTLLLITADSTAQIALLPQKLIENPSYLPIYAADREVEVVAILESADQDGNRKIRAMPLLELIEKQRESSLELS